MPDISHVPCKDKVQYIMGLALLARYWHRGDWEQLEWLLAVFRGHLPIGALRTEPCEKCKAQSPKTVFVAGIRLCSDCVKEFIQAHTMIANHEVPGPED